VAFLVVVAVLFAVAIVPVMIGARLVGARNTGAGAAFLSVFLLTVVSAACDRLIGTPLLNFLVAALIGGLLMAAVLGTTFWRALAVSVIATAIQVGIAVLFLGTVVAAA
jgi:hypothetical protein